MKKLSTAESLSSIARNRIKFLVAGIHGQQSVRVAPGGFIALEWWHTEIFYSVKSRLARRRDSLPRVDLFEPDVLISVIHAVSQSRTAVSVAQTMRELVTNSRLVFDYLRMTQNPCASTRS